MISIISSSASSNMELIELNNADISKIIEFLKESFMLGDRQLFLLSFGEYMADRKVSPVSAIKIGMKLNELVQDNKVSIRELVGSIIYGYKKKGINIDEYTDEILVMTGVKLSDLEEEMNKIGVKDCPKLIEVLEGIVGRERAIHIIYHVSGAIWNAVLKNTNLSEYIIGLPRVSKVDNIPSIDLINMTIVGSEIEEDYEYNPIRIIANVVPTRVVVYINPSKVTMKYEITFKSLVVQTFTLGPSTLEEIVDKLISNGLAIYDKQIVFDYLRAIIMEYMEAGIAEIKYDNS